MQQYFKQTSRNRFQLSKSSRVRLAAILVGALLGPAQAERADGARVASLADVPTVDRISQPGSKPGSAIEIRLQGRHQDRRRLPVGLDVSFDVEVVNSGRVDLHNVRVSDFAAPGCGLTIGHLPAGETVAYRCADSSGKSGTLEFREFIDRFEQVAFDNRDGLDAWNGAWQEVDSQGEGPQAGKIRVGRGSLRLRGASDGESSPSIARTLNLDGLQAAVMRIDWGSVDGAGDTAEVLLEISGDGQTYVELDRLSGPDDVTVGLRSYDISAWTSARTSVRFRVIGRHGGESRDFEVGSVEIQGRGWIGGHGYTNVVTVTGEDAAGTRVTARAESAVDFLPVRDDDESQTIQTVWIGADPFEGLHSSRPL